MGLKFSKIKEWCQKKLKALMRLLIYNWYTGIPELWTQELDAGLWTLDSGRWTLGTGLWMLDSGLGTLDSGRWTLDTGLWTLDAELCKLDYGQ